jgi:hypothetical protein
MWPIRQQSILLLQKIKYNLNRPKFTFKSCCLKEYDLMFMLEGNCWHWHPVGFPILYGISPENLAIKKWTKSVGNFLRKNGIVFVCVKENLF